VSSFFSWFFLTRFVTPHHHPDNRNHPQHITTHTRTHTFLHPGRIIILRPTYNTDLPNYTCLPTLTFIISIPQTFPARGALLSSALTVSLKTDLYFCFPLRSAFAHCLVISHTRVHSLLKSSNLSHSYVSIYNLII